MNSEENNKVEEIGLPKSTLSNFIKEILTSHNMKCEKQMFDLLDKITTKYVNHISTIASQVCTEKGKKTLNVDHVIQALKLMNFENHIKKLTSELDLTACQNEEKGKEIIEDAQEMKDLINQQKKKNKKKKRPIEFTEEMANEQLNLFASANIMMAVGDSRNGTNGNHHNHHNHNHHNHDDHHTASELEHDFRSSDIQDSNSKRVNGNKKMRLEQIENDLFAYTKNKNEEIDFD